MEHNSPVAQSDVLLQERPMGHRGHCPAPPQFRLTLAHCAVVHVDARVLEHRWYTVRSAREGQGAPEPRGKATMGR